MIYQKILNITFISSLCIFSYIAYKLNDRINNINPIPTDQVGTPAPEVKTIQVKSDIQGAKYFYLHYTGEYIHTKDFATTPEQVSFRRNLTLFLFETNANEKMYIMTKTSTDSIFSIGDRLEGFFIPIDGVWEYPKNKKCYIQSYIPVVIDSININTSK